MYANFVGIRSTKIYSGLGIYTFHVLERRTPGSSNDHKIERKLSMTYLDENGFDGDVL